MIYHAPKMNNYENAITNIPLFSLFGYKEICELVKIAKEKHIDKGDIIINQGDLVDAFYFVVSGAALVTRIRTEGGFSEKIIMAKLGCNDVIGLSKTGLTSNTGFSLTTITAQTSMRLYSFDIKVFNQFIRQHALLYPALKKETDLMILMQHIKQHADINTVMSSHLQQLPNIIKSVSYSQGETIFKQDDCANNLYFLMEGQVNFIDDKNNTTLQTLPVTIFGEESLTYDKKYTISATSKTNCYLLYFNTQSIKQITHKKISVRNLCKVPTINTKNNKAFGSLYADVLYVIKEIKKSYLRKVKS